MSRALRLVILFCLFLTSYGKIHGQVDRIESIKIRLTSIEDQVPQLEKKVSFSISNITLYEFLRGLAVNNKLNFNIDPSLKTEIATNFTDVTIFNLLVYLCEQYDLDIDINGNILSIYKFRVPEPLPQIVPPKIADISFNHTDQLLSFDLNNDTLSSVLKKITSLTNVNVIAPAAIQTRLVNGYVKDMHTADAIDELSHINNLQFVRKDSNLFYVEEVSIKNTLAEADVSKGIKLVTNNVDSIYSISANKIPIKDILSTVAQKLNTKYFLFSEIEGTSNLNVENITFDDFLTLLFNATEYSYKLKNGVYLIGDRKLEEIRTAEVYTLKYRTVTNIVEKLPKELKKNLEIIPMEELNSVIISGSIPSVKEMKKFLDEIDKTIPVINIELIILDIRRSNSISTGIMAGMDDGNTTSTYTSVFPSLDVTLSTNTINDIIDGINGTGMVNLGHVNTGFYVALKASEDNGFLKIRSTPRLATLNGQEAHMSIGESRYYVEQTTNVISTQSTTTVTGINYRELQANFGITIKPIVSGDEQITLDINVEQSTFTEQTIKDGPYGRLTRSFKSSIRVKNNDMLLLGGLEEKSTSDSGKGIPVLSRIPVIKWIFSSRDKKNQKNKLAILIHPTVFY